MVLLQICVFGNYAKRFSAAVPLTHKAVETAHRTTQTYPGKLATLSIFMFHVHHPETGQPHASTVHKAADNEDVVAVSKIVINDFLDRQEYFEPSCPHDLELTSRVKELSQSWDFEKQIRPHLITGIIIAETAYRHISSTDVKVAIAIFSGLVISIDDPAILDTLSPSEIGRRLCNGAAQHDTGLLRALARSIAEMWSHFPPFAVGTILASTIQFITVSMLENATRGVSLSPRALPFVEYRRFMAGVAEAYVCFIWESTTFSDVNIYKQIIPDACRWINYTNDILSFYKEELAADVDTYVHARAVLTAKSSLDTLRDVIDDTIDASQRIRAILGEGAARDAWDSFAVGYIRFHTGSPRYRLAELLSVDYILDLTSY